MYLFLIYLFVYLFGHSHLQQRMAEAGVLVCLMLAATLFIQTLRFQTEVNFWDGWKDQAAFETCE